MADLAIAIKIATEDASSGPIGKIKGALGGLGDAVSAPTRALGGLVSGLGSLGLAAAGVGAAFDAVKGAGSLLGLGALNEMEQTRASFNAFTKDAAVTEELLAKVREEAAKTPFAFGEMAKATASLLPVSKSSGAALDDLVKQAEILAASNPMEGLEGASFSLREAMTGDFTSIIERFNLSRSSINKWKEEGVPNIEIVRRAMAEMGFDSDLIAAKAETLDGRWSTFQDTLQTLQMRMGQPIFDAMKEGLSTLQPLLDDNMATFEGWADTVAGAFTETIKLAQNLFDIFRGGDSFDAAAEVLDKLFPPAVTDGILRVVDELGAAFDALFAGDLPSLLSGAQGVIEGFGEIIVGAVESWATSFAAWVDGADTGMMDGLGELWINFQTWLQESGFKIIETLGRWGAAFIDWIGPKIPPMLEALGGFLAEITGWMLTTGLPNLLAKLAEWGLAFVSWVVPRIPGLLLALGELLLKLGDWALNTALPKIRDQLLEWGVAFGKWVPGAIVNLLFELGKLEVQFLGWIASKIAGIATAALELGKGLVTGIQDGISGALGGFWSWLQSSFVDKIPEFVRKLLNINSPSGVFMDIGANMVAGLRVGMERELPTIEGLVSRVLGNLGGGVGSSGGKVRDYIIEAAARRGIDPRAALAVARHEGGEDDYMQVGRFDTGWSFWPFQLHYGGAGYEHFGTKAGMGNDFTRRTGLQPGDPEAWDESIDFALDHARRYGWGAWYGRGPAGIGEFEGIPGYATGGIAWQPQLAMVAEREPELIVPLSRIRAGGVEGGSDYDRLGQAVAMHLAPLIARSGRDIHVHGDGLDDTLRKVRRIQRGGELLAGARGGPR